MSDISNDESRLRATEAQMRRALGLQETAAPKSTPVTAPASSAGQHRPARRFVRDGEVAVSVIHRDDAAGTNLLETTRQALRAQTTAREQAERLLAEAQEAIRDLQTKLAHERMAKDEASARIAAEKQVNEQALKTLEAELLAGRTAWQQTTLERAAALERCQVLEQRLHALMAARQIEESPAETRGAETKPRWAAETTRESAADHTVQEQPTPARRRGRPRKVSQPQPEPQSEFVEWWKPGWKDRYR